MIFQNFMYGELDNIGKYVEIQRFDKLPEPSKEFEYILAVTESHKTETAFCCLKVRDQYQWVEAFHIQDQFITSVNSDYFTVTDGKLNFNESLLVTKNYVDEELSKKQNTLQFAGGLKLDGNILSVDISTIPTRDLDLADNQSIINIQQELDAVKSSVIETAEDVETLETTVNHHQNSIENLEQDLMGEANTRFTKDDELEQAIVEVADEISAVETKFDTELDQVKVSISEETAARITADGELHIYIDSEVINVKNLINQELANRVSGDNDLDVKLHQESLGRIQGDSELYEYINITKQEFASEGAKINHRINDLKVYTDSEIGIVKNLLATEINDRDAGDMAIYFELSEVSTEINERIDDEIIARNDADSNIYKYVDSEFLKTYELLSQKQKELVADKGIEIDDNKIAVKIAENSGLLFRDDSLDVKVGYGLQQIGTTGEISTFIGDGLKYKDTTTDPADSGTPVMVNLGKGLMFDGTDANRPITIDLGNYLQFVNNKLTVNMSSELNRVSGEATEGTQQAEDRIMDNVADTIKSAFTIDAKATGLELSGISNLDADGKPVASNTKLRLGKKEAELSIDGASIIKVDKDGLEVPNGRLKARDLEVEQINIGGWIFTPRTDNNGNHILDVWWGGN